MSTPSTQQTGLRGTIPAALGSLSSLEHIALDTNLLTGTVPPSLCGPDSKLRDIYLRSNMLTGVIEFVGCPNLINLDVQVCWVGVGVGVGCS